MYSGRRRPLHRVLTSPMVLSLALGTRCENAVTLHRGSSLGAVGWCGEFPTGGVPVGRLGSGYSGSVLPPLQVLANVAHCYCG